MTEQIEQRSDEWFAARCGSLGASQVALAMARTKSGWGASRANVMAQLIVERLTGIPTDGYTSAAMQWGIDTEPTARAAYEFMRDAEVVEVGLIRHPKIEGSHASPDGLVGEKGLIEIKCPNSATHIDTLLSGKVPGNYWTQMQWQMACTDRKWCDFVSFDPRLPADLQLWVSRVDRDDEAIKAMEADVAAFLAEMEQKLSSLQSLREAA